MKLPYYPVGSQDPFAKLNDVENLKANFEAYKDYVEARFEIMEKKISELDEMLVKTMAKIDSPERKKKSSSRKNKSENVAPSSLSSEKLDS